MSWGIHPPIMSKFKCLYPCVVQTVPWHVQEYKLWYFLQVFYTGFIEEFLIISSHLPIGSNQRIFGENLSSLAFWLSHSNGWNLPHTVLVIMSVELIFFRNCDFVRVCSSLRILLCSRYFTKTTFLQQLDLTSSMERKKSYWDFWHYMNRASWWWIVNLFEICRG